jgi:hypothetical protein
MEGDNNTAESSTSAHVALPVRGRLIGTVVSRLQQDDMESTQAWLDDPDTHVEDTESEKHQTAVLLCSRAGSATSLRLVLAAGANPNISLGNGATALYLAAQHGHSHCIEVLLANFANSNAGLANGATPLFISALGGQVECLDLLLQSGKAI